VIIEDLDIVIIEILFFFYFDNAKPLIKQYCGLPISVRQVRWWIKTGMVGAIGRRIQGECRWMSWMVLGPVRLKTGTSQQFGSRGSYAVFAGFNRSGSCVQGGNLFRSSFVR